MLSSFSSPNILPISIIPHGSLIFSSSGERMSAREGGTKPQGMLIVGWPVRFEEAVLEMIPAVKWSCQEREEKVGEEVGKEGKDTRVAFAQASGPASGAT